MCSSITVSRHFMIAHSWSVTFSGRLRSCTAPPSLLRQNCGGTRSMPDGIVWDTGRALDLLKTVLAEFDYRDLDELAEFRGCNTTTEFLACEVHKRMARRIKEGALGSQAITSLRVVLRENSVAGAAYDTTLG